MDPLCPLDYRYGREDFRALFTEAGRLGYILRVEAALARAHAAAGTIPTDAAEEIARKATLEHVKPERVRQIEATIRHDLMAVVQALAEQCQGGAGEWVHLGATSYDIIDTANALQMRDATDILAKEIERLEAALAKHARKHQRTPCVARTHGQHAIPTTFGYKMATFLLEAWRHRQRLLEAKDRCLVGKMMGAVGTGAGFGEGAFDIESRVAQDLGVPMEEAPTQIVARDRYTEIFSHLANVATSMERFATEVRNLQRTEIGEAAEGFDVAQQVGSSTMAQKRNPVVSERVCGLARTCRSMLGAAFDNQLQWHERDLANSAAERFLVPHVFVLAHAAVEGTAEVFEHLVVNEERMLQNLRGSPTITAEAAMLHLARKGLGRQRAHEIVRQASMGAQSRDEFVERLLKNPEAAKLAPKKDLVDVTDPVKYVGKAPELTERALRITGRA